MPKILQPSIRSAIIYPFHRFAFSPTHSSRPIFSPSPLQLSFYSSTNETANVPPSESVPTSSQHQDDDQSSSTHVNEELLGKVPAANFVNLYAKLEDPGKVWAALQAMHTRHVLLSELPKMQILNLVNLLAELPAEHILAFLDKLDDDIAASSPTCTLFTSTFGPNTSDMAHWKSQLYGVFIGHVLYRDDRNLIKSICDRMKKNDIQADPMTLSLLINFFLEDKDFETAKNLYMEVQSRHLNPVYINFDSLIDASVREGDMELAEQALNDLTMQGLKARPSHYGKIIRGHSKVGGDVDRAAQHLTTMRDKGLTPSAQDYDNIIRGFVREGDLPKAEKHLTEMLQDGIDSQDRHHIDFVNAYLKKGSKIDAERHIEYLKNRGIDIHKVAAPEGLQSE